MNQSRPPWEPPMAGTEAEHLVGILERQRATFRWKLDGLDLIREATDGRVGEDPPADWHVRAVAI